MKKLFSLTLCAALLVSFATVSFAADAAMPGMYLPDSSESDGAISGMPNPMERYTTPDFTEKAGFKITGLPAFDGKALTLSECWLIAGTTADLRLTFPGSQTASLRVAVDKGNDISGVYTTFDKVETKEINKLSVELSTSTATGPAMARWTQGHSRLVLYFDSVDPAFFQTAASVFPGNVHMEGAVVDDIHITVVG